MNILFLKLKTKNIFFFFYQVIFIALNYELQTLFIANDGGAKYRVNQIITFLKKIINIQRFHRYNSFQCVVVLYLFYRS